MKYLIPQAYHKYFCYCVSPQFSTVWNTTQANLLNSIVKFFFESQSHRGINFESKLAASAVVVMKCNAHNKVL